MDEDRSTARPRDAGTDKLTAELAYQLWQENGCAEGRALEYWLEAERRLATSAAEQSAAGGNGVAERG
jgi:hypothetical protein